MNQTSKEPEFIKTIGEIRGAEEEHDRLIMEAKEKADRILREAKEKIADEKASTSEKIVQLKNERLREGNKAIESKVQTLVKKAKDDSSKISKKSLGKPAVSKLVKDFLKDL